MKSIKTIITTLAIFSTLCSLSAQSNGSVNLGLQYFSGKYSIKEFNVGGDVAGIMLALGGEYKYAKFLSGEVSLGVLGKQGSGVNELNFMSAQIAPIRLHFGKEGIGGFYFGPKLFLQSLSDYEGFTINGLEIGASLGFNIVSKKLPIVIGLNTSLSVSSWSEFRRIGSGVISIGYQL